MRGFAFWGGLVVLAGCISGLLMIIFSPFDPFNGQSKQIANARLASATTASLLKSDRTSAPITVEKLEQKLSGMDHFFKQMPFDESTLAKTRQLPFVEQDMFLRPKLIEFQISQLGDRLTELESKAGMKSGDSWLKWLGGLLLSGIIWLLGVFLKPRVEHQSKRYFSIP